MSSNDTILALKVAVVEAVNKFAHEHREEVNSTFGLRPTGTNAELRAKVEKLTSELATLKKEFAALKKELVEANEKHIDLFGYGHEMNAERLRFKGLYDAASTERVALRALLGGEVRESLVARHDWLVEKLRLKEGESTMESLLIARIDAALQPASETGAVRVFEDTTQWWIFIPGNKFGKRLTKSDMQWLICATPRTPDEWKREYPDDRELSPSEVAALLRAHPLPPEAATNGAETLPDNDTSGVDPNPLPYAAEYLQIVNLDGKPLRRVPWAEVAKGGAK